MKRLDGFLMPCCNEAIPSCWACMDCLWRRNAQAMRPCRAPTGVVARPLEVAGDAMRGVRERVHFLGWREDLPELMAMADLVLLPSRWEGMPYVVLEAMAAAKAVVATRVDGACDLVVPGETGALVEVGEPAAIAGALADLLGRGPAGLAELGAAGSARVRSKYTTEHMVAATRRVFQEALQATGVESLGRPA